MNDSITYPKDSDGNPCYFLNFYECEVCEETWEDEWSCACDDRCPRCDTSTSPYAFHDRTPETDPNVIHAPDNCTVYVLVTDTSCGGTEAQVFQTYELMNAALTVWCLSRWYDDYGSHFGMNGEAMLEVLREHDHEDLAWPEVHTVNTTFEVDKSAALREQARHNRLPYAAEREHMSVHLHGFVELDNGDKEYSDDDEEITRCGGWSVYLRCETPFDKGDPRNGAVAQPFMTCLEQDFADYESASSYAGDLGQAFKNDPGDWTHD